MKRQIVFLWLCILGAMPTAAVAGDNDPNPATIHSEHGAWPLYRQWTPAETGHFAKWIENIYAVKSTGSREQQLAKLEGVLTDPETNLLLDPAFVGSLSNPQLPVKTIRAVHPVIDCGKLTVVLGAYYAYRRGLPWMQTGIRSGDGTDIRTAAFNVPTRTVSCRDYPSAHRFFVDAVYGFCTGNYRINPDQQKAEWSDTAPVAIDPEHLKPGCLFYLDGHVLMLADVDPYGEVSFLDATVSTTRDIYTHNGFNAVTGIQPKSADTGYAGCYRGFRTFRYPIAETDANGRVTRVRRRTDEEMKAFGYSLEQYDKLQALMQNGTIQVDGVAVDTFHDFVRRRLRQADRIAPVQIIQDYAKRTVGALEEREKRVQAAWGDVQTNGPIPFPVKSKARTIFNTGGRWGEHATSLMDTRLRADYFELIDAMENAVNWWRKEPGAVVLPDAIANQAALGPASLVRALIDAKNDVFAAHTFTYMASGGKRVTLTLQEFEDRLYDISFNPNQPPELRWGAPLEGPEAQFAHTPKTPLTEGSPLPMREAYRRAAYYRALTYRTVEENYLEGMITEGFPVRSKFDEYLRGQWGADPVPPLVPHGWRLAKANG